jgi:hypothetical protein
MAIFGPINACSRSGSIITVISLNFRILEDAGTEKRRVSKTEPDLEKKCAGSVETDRWPIWRRSIGYQNSHLNSALGIVAVFDLNLNLATSGDWDRLSENLMCIHDEWKRIVRFNVCGKWGTVGLVRCRPRYLIGRLDVPVDAVESDNKRPIGSQGEEFLRPER